MIQIFVERPTTINGVTKKTFRSGDLQVESVPELFKNIEKYVEQFPGNGRYNLHYTLAHCYEGTRKFEYQDILPIDIDGIDTANIEAYILPVCYLLKCERTDIGIVASGNGLHFLVNIGRFDDPDFFKTTALLYKQLCLMINKELKKQGLKGEADTQIWSLAHTLRVPETKNVKTPDTGYYSKNSITECKLINRFIINPPVNIHTLVNMPEVRKEDELSNYDEIARLIPVDTNAVLEQCSFLLHCKANQEQVRETDWYTMLSIVSRLEKGRELCHEMSCAHPGYSHDETEAKIDHVLSASKPKTCKYIRNSFDACLDCQHWGHINSPISIKGEDFIASKANGFYHITKKEVADPTTGVVKTTLAKGKPDFEGLVKYFDQLHDHIVTEHGLYVWKDTHWVIFKDQYVNAFAEDNFNPKPSTSMVSEFMNKLYRTKVRDLEWMGESIEKKVNLRNGVLDVSDPSNPTLMSKHSKKYGFTYCLDYEYDPLATCPTFDRYLADVTERKPLLQDILREFMAYSVFSYPCTMGKALFLVGDGKNGKSVFVNTLRELVGPKQCAPLTLGDLGNDQRIAMLVGKSLNISEETSANALKDNTSFKSLTTGGVVLAKVVYKEPFSMVNTAKFVILSNELPECSDTNQGQLRRMLVVPFTATFDGDREDIYIADKMKKELSGILNRTIEASKNLSLRGRFTVAQEVVDAVNNFAIENDSVRAFCYNNLEADKSSRVEFKKLYNLYLDYCNSNGFKKVETSIKFSEKIKRAMPDIKTVKKGQYRVTNFSGIKVLGEYKEETEF